MGLPFEPLPSHPDDRFPGSLREPKPSSRRLYAGRHAGSKQVTPTLIPKQLLNPGFDVINAFRHVVSGSLTFVSSAHNYRGHKAAIFPCYLPRWLFTIAAQGVLQPGPATRLRGARPHLTHSFLAYSNSAFLLAVPGIEHCQSRDWLLL